MRTPPYQPGDRCKLLAGPCKGAECAVEWVTVHAGGILTYGIRPLEEEVLRILEGTTGKKKRKKVTEEGEGRNVSATEIETVPGEQPQDPRTIIVDGWWITQEAPAEILEVARKWLFHQDQPCEECGPEEGCIDLFRIEIDLRWAIRRHG